MSAFSLLLALHLLGVVVWVGGMLFAHAFLRPSLELLAPADRLRLMHAVLGRFFAAVALAVVGVLGSGFGMIGLAHAGGGGFRMPWDWGLMTATGLVMTVVFLHIRLLLYPRLGRALAAGELPRAAGALAAIRRWVALNLALGLALVLLVPLV